MTEKLSKAESRANSHEADANAEKHRKAHEAHAAKIEQDAANAPELSVEKARRDVEKEASRSGDQLDKQPAQSAQRILHVSLPSIEPVVDAIAKTWSSIRQNLSPSQRAYSKVIHNKVVSSVSEFTAKTLARPYAILAGGLTTVVGSSVYLYFTRHFGYNYNFFVPIFLFAGGLGIGLLVEIFYKAFTSSHE